MPDVSIVIVTRDRKQTAEKAVASAVEQEGDHEVLVYDDASTDGSADYIAAKFPGVRVQRAEQRAGYIVQRNRATRLAAGRVILSVDDDAVFTDRATARQTLRLFEHPRVGAVSVPFVNHINGQDSSMLLDPPDNVGFWVRNTFIGTAYAVRRDVFLALGGFAEPLFHWGEEGEYSQRLLGAGYVVRAGTAGKIRHFPAGSGKYSRKVIRYIYRNNLLVPWRNVPASKLAPVLAGRTVQALLRGARKPHEALAALEGLLMGYGAIARGWAERRPLPADVWRLWMDLRARKLTPFQEIEPRLPPMLMPQTSSAEPAAVGAR